MVESGRRLHLWMLLINLISPSPHNFKKWLKCSYKSIVFSYKMALCCHWKSLHIPSVQVTCDNVVWTMPTCTFQNPQAPQNSLKHPMTQKDSLRPVRGMKANLPYFEGFPAPLGPFTHLKTCLVKDISRDHWRVPWIAMIQWWTCMSTGPLKVAYAWSTYEVVPEILLKPKTFLPRWPHKLCLTSWALCHILLTFGNLSVILYSEPAFKTPNKCTETSQSASCPQNALF